VGEVAVADPNPVLEPNYLTVRANVSAEKRQNFVPWYEGDPGEMQYDIPGDRLARDYPEAFDRSERRREATLEQRSENTYYLPCGMCGAMAGQCSCLT
jgi:hypothetical protein